MKFMLEADTESDDFAVVKVIHVRDEGAFISLARVAIKLDLVDGQLQVEVGAVNTTNKPDVQFVGVES